MTAATQAEVTELGNRWAAAERATDVAALNALLTDDFVAVGPRGFVLDRQQWLDRFRSGDLKNEALTLQDLSVRDYENVAVAVGIQEQRTTYQGHDASGRFPIGLIAVRQAGQAGQAGQWLIAGLHLSGPLMESPPSRG